MTIRVSLGASSLGGQVERTSALGVKAGSTGSGLFVCGGDSAGCSLRAHAKALARDFHSLGTLRHLPVAHLLCASSVDVPRV
jgi:hypothetical protein